MEGVEPTTPRLQITCSSQLSYIGIVFPLFFVTLFLNWDCKDRYYFLFSKTFAEIFAFSSKILALIPALSSP